MASMFETIRSLPLLKGITEEQVAEFLEHTNVRFTDYAPGESIVQAGAEVTELSFLISGTLRISHVSQSGRFTLHHSPPHGHPLFAFRLFGLSNAAPAGAVALTPVTILSFPKADYLNLLRSDHIYQICALNFLSARVQHSAQAALIDTDNSLALWLTRTLLALTPRGASDISFELQTDEPASLLGLPSDKIKQEIVLLESRDLIKTSKNSIDIINRNELIDYTLHLSTI